MTTQELFTYLSFQQKLFDAKCIIFNGTAVPQGLSTIENDAHDIEKLLLKAQISEKFLHSEVNLLIQYIIVKDQDGQKQ